MARYGKMTDMNSSYASGTKDSRGGGKQSYGRKKLPPIAAQQRDSRGIPNPVGMSAKGSSHWSKASDRLPENF